MVPPRRSKRLWDVGWIELPGTRHDRPNEFVISIDRMRDELGAEVSEHELATGLHRLTHRSGER